MELEDRMAPVIGRIVASSALPRHRSDDHLWLLMFVALQALRTPRAAEVSNAILEGWLDSLPDSNDGVTLEDVNTLRSSANLVLASFFLRYASVIMDLSLHLIIARKYQYFITSDHPVCSYNQYYEGNSYIGGTGINNRGLQMFLPLSPKHMLVLYDSSIYKFASRKIDISDNPADKDISLLNTLQIISAGENVYYNNTTLEKQISTLTSKAMKYRRQRIVNHKEYIDYSNQEIYIVETQNVPNIGMNLSMCKTHEKERRRIDAEKTNPNFLHRKK